MKICTYCKSEIEDSCLQCPNCGASEFEHKCPVCGCSHKGGACPECTMQAVSEAVGSAAVLTGRMKDMLSKIETKGGVENSKAENGEDIPVSQNHPVYSSWHIFLSAGPCHNHNSDSCLYSHNR